MSQRWRCADPECDARWSDTREIPCFVCGYPPVATRSWVSITSQYSPGDSVPARARAVGSDCDY